ncbi:MAG: PorT family protein [Bacteroidaceae bacterium]|nr:PorT family protein [Bacteroidaceae bacterium]
MMSKKHLLATLFVAFTAVFTASAQVQTISVGKGRDYASQSYNRWRTYDRRNYVGVRVGLDIPQMFMGLLAAEAPNRHALPGFSTGLVFGFTVSNDLPLILETGLMYMGKGVVIEENRDMTAPQQKMKIRMHYVELPLVFKYRIDTNLDDFNLQPFFGGFFAIGAGGSTKYFGLDTTPPLERHKESTFRHEGFQKFDAGLKLGCGMAYQNFYFELGYELGLVNVANDDLVDFDYNEFDDHIRTGNFSVSVGLNF